MPLKRKPKASKHKKKIGIIKNETSSIVSRLLEISLKVDNYVYKMIPISARDATLLLHEVRGYKDKCVGNKQTLQVIEKVERCMKSIIEGKDEELNDFNVYNTNREENNSNGYNSTTQRNIVLDNQTQSNVGVAHNNEIENDLSWIENLRYIREISAEEILPVYYEDSFWESNILPNDWNDVEWF